MSDVTAHAQAYTLLKTAILKGEFRPGDALREEQLAAAYGVSRTPIRQAMRQLVSEGLIEIGENKRSHVIDIDAATLEQMFDVQAMIESYSAGLAAERMTDERLAEIKAIQSALEADYFGGTAHDDSVYFEHNTRFHTAVHRCNGNPRLYDIVENLVEVPVAMFIKFGRSTNSDVSIDYHRKIIEALELRDARLTSLLMQTHIETVRQEYRQLLRQAQAPQGDA